MDFQRLYTGAQEDLRLKVASWLDATIGPRGCRFDDDGLDCLRQGLGRQGWLSPVCPSEWGGAGLSAEEELMIREELDRRELSLLAAGPVQLHRALTQWGSAPQRQRWLPEVVRGDTALATPFIERNACLDWRNLGIEARRQGNDYVLGGVGDFIGAGGKPGTLWCLAVTDGDAPPHRQVSSFLVPADWPGVILARKAHPAPGSRHAAAFQRVRVTRRHLIGGEGDGWAIAASTLLTDNGEDGFPYLDSLVTGLLDYARETTRQGVPLSEDEDLRPLLTEAHVEREIGRLWYARNRWLEETGQNLGYRRAQYALWAKRASARLAEIVRAVIGPYALLDQDDPLAPYGGRFHRHQRRSLALQNPGGAGEVQAAAMAESLGLTSTNEASPARVRETVVAAHTEPALEVMSTGG